MSSWNVFVAYRHDDGGAAAEWLYRRLHDRPVESAAPQAPRLLLYYDQVAPAVADWRSVHGRRLDGAAAFILVCSPGAAHEREAERDELYEEIRWWLRRRSTAPILVETVGRSGAWIPAEVQKRWPDAQRLRVEADAWLGDRPEPAPEEERVRDRILAGIRMSQRRVMDDELAARRRRQRVLTALLGALLVLLGLTVAATAYGCEQRRQAETRAVLAEQRRAETLMRQGLDLCETGRADLGLLYLAEARRVVPPGSQDLCRVLDAQLAGGFATLNRLEAQWPCELSVQRLAGTSTGDRLAVGASDQGRTRVVVVDLADPGRQWTRSYDHALGALGLTSDGRHVVAGLEKGDAYVSASDADQAGTALETDDEVSAVDGSADGRWLAVGSAGGDVRVRPPLSDEGEILLAGDERGKVLGLRFVPPSERTGLLGEGPELLVAYAARGPLLWNVSEPRHRELDAGMAGTFVRAAFATHPLRVAVSGKHGPVRSVVHLFEIHADGVRHAVIHPPVPAKSLALEPGPGDRRCLTGADDWKVRCYASDGSLLRTFEHGYAITDVCFVPGTHWIGTASQDLTAAIWDTRTGLRVGSPLRHPRSPTAIRAVTVGGKAHVVTGCWDGVVRLWALPLPERVGFSLYHEAPGVDAALVPGSRWAVTGGVDGRVAEWDLETGRLRRELRPPGQGGSIRSVSTGPGGRVVSGGYVGRLWIWKSREPSRLSAGRPKLGTVHDVDVSEDGLWAAAGCQSGDVFCWDLDFGGPRPLAPSRGIEGAVSVVRFSPTGKYVAAGGEDDVVRVFDPSTRREVVPGVDHGGNVLHLAFSPDERRLATAGEGRYARIWDLETGREVLRLGPHEDHVDHVLFDPSGRLVVTASYDHTARVWRLGDEATRVAVLRHPGRVGVACFAPGAATVFTGCADGVVREWDVDTGVLLRTLTYGGEVRVVEVREAASELEVLASGGAAHARVWRIPTLGRDADRTTPATIEHATGLHLDRDGTVRFLEPEAWRTRTAP